MNDFEKSLNIVLSELNIYSTNDVKKIYHNLVKVYHPDALNGDAEVFRKLQTINDYLNDYLLTRNITIVDNGDLEDSLKYFLSCFDINIDSLDKEISVVKTLMTYETNIGNKETYNKLFNIYNEIKSEINNNDANDYKKKVDSFLNKFYTFEVKNYIKVNPNNGEIIEKYGELINDLVSKTSAKLSKINSEKEINTFMKEEFVLKYRDIMLEFVEDYLKKYHLDKEQLERVLKSYKEEINSSFKDMTLINVCKELKEYTKNIKATSSNQENYEELRSSRNKTKGLLNHLSKSGYIDEDIYSKYYYLLNNARSINDVEHIYQELYNNYYYENHINKTKYNVMKRYTDYFNKNKKLDYFNSVDTLYRIYDYLETQRIDSNMMRYLDNIDFGDINSINEYLDQIEALNEGR